MSFSRWSGAAGADLKKQPAKWREHEGTREFVADVAEAILLIEEDELFEAERGHYGIFP